MDIQDRSANVQSTTKVATRTRRFIDQNGFDMAVMLPSSVDLIQVADMNRTLRRWMVITRSYDYGNVDDDDDDDDDER